MNSAELANNWTKIEFLTSLTYPLGNLNQPYNKKAYQSGEIGSVRAPIIYFTMGDLYKDKICFIDSLQYTIPDNSNWQLDGKTLSETERPVNESGSTNPNPTPNYFSTVGSDKLDVIPIARDLLELGFKLVATSGTAKELAKNGLEVSTVFKVGEGRPNIVDGIKNGEINLVINTPMGARARYDEESIGRACIQHGIVAITTLSGANAALRAIRVASKKIELDSIQNYHL